MSDEDRPLDPAQMLHTLEHQQKLTVERTSVSSSLLYLAWGLALTGGNIAMYLGVDRQTLTPAAWSALVYLVLLVAAGVLTFGHVRSRTAGLSSPDLRGSTLWGLSWPIAYAAYALLGAGLVRAGADGRVTAHYYAIGAMIVVGTMYLAAGAVFRETLPFLGGLVVLAGAGVAALTGLPAGYLVMAALCGGGLIVLAVVFWSGITDDRA